MSTVASWGRVIWVGLVIGFLLNLTGWIGNNFLLGGLWSQVVVPEGGSIWRDSIWRDVFSLVPDFVYGLGIAWLIARTRSSGSYLSESLAAGSFVALVGGLTTYFAVANSGFIPWTLAAASFALVLATKLPLAVVAGRMLRSSGGSN